ncbi:IS607 family transposase [Faecalibaculum rodentium]|uniref:IS607 family transposase n=1 Tax=Faecalibaculum rodentium TaxID=1702221 RepID=UPI0027313737|nr:IS607 family transposase [Faecalibaculum rodentium]
MIRKSGLTKDFYKPKEVGTMIGRGPRTVSNMVRAGKLEAIRSDTNRILIPRDSVAKLLEQSGLLLEDEDARRDAIYARVSSHEQKNRGDLERQVLDIMNACEKEGLDKPVIIRDTGSGLNTKRKGLVRLIEMAKNHEIKRIFITSKDRLTRFGYEYLEELFAMAGVELTALQEEENKDLQEELVDDMMSLLASFSGKLYRIRGNKKKKMREIIDSVPEEDRE